MEMEADRGRTTDVDAYVLGFLGRYCRDIFRLPFLNGRLGRYTNVNASYRRMGHHLTLSASLAKNTAPFPIPSVPFFFFPFLSISESDQVLISSAGALAVEATLSAGSM